ncbi:MAG: hypothetical protein ACD_65C00060G0002 [uncultured bacterium]|nr:MAG: hypothetical protein ACD_65C00060G0002 [uncultured bacterium]
MKRDYYYTNPNKTRKNRKKVFAKPRLLSEEIRSTYYLLICTLGVMILVLSLGYLYVSSQKSAKGYLLKELQLDYESLTSESKELETQLINAQSFQEIEETETVEGMDKPNDEEFSFMENSGNVAQN